MDVDTTISQNTAKEAFEEAGLNVLPRRLIALQEHNLHNPPTLAIGIVKIFVLCERVSGEFKANIETVRSGFFAPDRTSAAGREQDHGGAGAHVPGPRRRTQIGSRCLIRGTVHMSTVTEVPRVPRRGAPVV